LPTTPPPPPAPPLPPDLLAELFRHRHAAMVAGLCRILGPQRLELVEDVVQEAMLRALRVWPVEGVPEQPEAWLFRVARNAALDALRRARIGARVEAELQQWAATEAGPPAAPATIADDTLRMLFLCSHPDVPTEARVPLLLKHVCGFGVPAIARALLQQEATIAQRLTRAKAKLQQGAQFELPPAEQLPARLDLVLAAIYLLFNEGHRAHAGSTLLRPELIDEAARLCALLLQQPALRRPRVHALLALILLLGARSPARTTADGELIPLARQDRSRWDRAWLQYGFHHFRAGIGGEVLSPFHVEAAIASVHAAAPDYASTDWPRILRHYDQLQALQPSPIVRLNRAIAVGKVQGAAAGLVALAGLDRDRAMRDYGLLHAVTAQLHWELGDHAAAGACLRQALQHPCSEPERRLLERRLAACERGEPVGPW
jgi:RNA polymerase sigma-70 factor (ECF subfamily)